MSSNARPGFSSTVLLVASKMTLLGVKYCFLANECEVTNSKCPKIISVGYVALTKVNLGAFGKGEWGIIDRVCDPRCQPLRPWLLVMTTLGVRPCLSVR